jgi:hypothetical protein
MKKYLITLGALALLLSACGPVYVVHQDPPPPPPPAATPAPPEDVTYQTFYDQLSPYGQWIENPDYGYVWLPDAGPDFKPYATNGHWVYTDEGWAWDSGYPWGWATFHYGRWFFQDNYGWMWVPGNEWAPAWVQWRNSNEYYGWAPLAPNVSINVAVGGGYTPPPHYWCFVPHQYVASPQINNYYVRETNNVTIINRTTIINNTTVINHTRNNYYGGGPDPNEVGRFGGAPVRPIPVHESRAPGERATSADFVVYRPRVNAAPAGDMRPGGGMSRPAPTRFQTLDNARPVNRNSYGNNGYTGWNNGNRDNNGWNNGNNGDRGNNGWNNNNNNGDRGNNGWHGNNPARNNGDNGWNNGNNGNGNNGNGDRGNNGWNNGNNGNNGNGNNGNGNNGWHGNNPNRNNGDNGRNDQPAYRATPGYSNQQPANNPPVNNTPANNSPFNNQPANNRPAFNNPGNNPANSPANNPPANNNPTFNRPGANPYARPGAQPANNPRMNNMPANNQPANSQPTNTQPANNPATNQPGQARPGNAFGRPFRQTDNNPQARPANNPARPAPAQRPQPSDNKDKPGRDNRQ